MESWEYWTVSAGERPGRTSTTAATTRRIHRNSSERPVTEEQQETVQLSVLLVFVKEILDLFDALFDILVFAVGRAWV